MIEDKNTDVMNSVINNNEKKSSMEDQKGQKSVDANIVQTLIYLYTLQQLDTQIDKLRIIRGELPLDVQNLEDEIIGLQKRLQTHEQEVEERRKNISNLKISIKRSLDLITKYEEQLYNVRNNREYDSLSKEIENQHLSIKLYEKNINDLNIEITKFLESIENIKQEIENKKIDLAEKKNELEEITRETAEDEKKLMKFRAEVEALMEKRLLLSYDKLRKKERNGLAVVAIERDACGGCFNRIPLQRQYEIKLHKAILVCEYCGRILVDDSIVEAANEYLKKFSL